MPRHVGLVLLVPCVLQACTAQSWYAGSLQGAEAECRRKPGEAMQRCLENLKKQSYEDYDKERRSAR